MSEKLKTLFWKIQKNHYDIVNSDKERFKETHGDWLKFRKKLFDELKWDKKR